ncbi:MAG: cell division protein FtsZ, partial [Candidatus Devosia euplotis]|nr:cell division protein FtsZ [Candidatus Devosia euplotis]
QPAEKEAPAFSVADDAAARSAIETGGAKTSRVSAPVDGAHGNLAPHGRQPSSAPKKESLEIPAFLRKRG